MLFVTEANVCKWSSCCYFAGVESVPPRDLMSDAGL